jgi:hypothetical protein
VLRFKNSVQVKTGRPYTGVEWGTTPIAVTNPGSYPDWRKNALTSSFRGAGFAREPGIQDTGARRSDFGRCPGMHRTALSVGPWRHRSAGCRARAGHPPSGTRAAMQEVGAPSIKRLTPAWNQTGTPRSAMVSSIEWWRPKKEFADDSRPWLLC